MKRILRHWRYHVEKPSFSYKPALMGDTSQSSEDQNVVEIQTVKVRLKKFQVGTKIPLAARLDGDPVCYGLVGNLCSFCLCFETL